MRKSWLMCVLMSALAWGQATPAPPAQAASPAPPQAAGEAAKPPAPKELPEDAVVLTIKGVCAPAPKTATAAKTGTAKTAAARKPADCETRITRAQFEKLTKALQQGPNPLNPQQKRQLATLLPRFMALSDAAKEQGLDKSERFTEMMKFYRMQVLSQELQHHVNDEADKIPQAKIEAYYKDHPQDYEQFSLDRLFIPKYKQYPPEEDAKDQKLTDEQQKAKEAADKTKQEQGEQELTKLADTLRERAAAGEDFVKLQKEAFEAAGQKVDNPTVNLPKVRRTGLPSAHTAVFDLKAGEVSQVITDNGGHYIYKVVSKDELPLDQQLQTEIHNKIKNERVKEDMDKYTNSFQAVPNEDYFGPPGPPAGAMPPPRRGLPHPPQPQQTPPAAQPPASNRQ
ncbi:MAG TPA: peptidylprolyl isomerase [Candidatus Binatia bacterium]|nr:peptidylprolyl isomerase [Candidatus Binatia bacterium]